MVVTNIFLQIDFVKGFVRISTQRTLMSKQTDKTNPIIKKYETHKNDFPDWIQLYYVPGRTKSRLISWQKKGLATPAKESAKYVTWNVYQLIIVLLLSYTSAVVDHLNTPLLRRHFNVNTSSLLYLGREQCHNEVVGLEYIQDSLHHVVVVCQRDVCFETYVWAAGLRCNMYSVVAVFHQTVQRETDRVEQTTVVHRTR